jgi:hypothetical protein
MRSIEDVGRTKAVGYLPLATLEKVLGLEPEELRKQSIARSLEVRIFEEGKCCIKSGAIFVYDSVLFKKIAEKFREEILARGWIAECDFLIERIATNWFSEQEPVLQFISALYGENGRMIG